MPELTDAGHELICGIIGMGKSSWVLYKIVKSFLYNKPCCYIDPKGDTYLALLNFFVGTSQGREIWDSYSDRIVLVNPVSTGDGMVAFNAIKPLEVLPHAAPDCIALQANSLVSHIRRQSGFEMAEANRMQNVMSAAIGLLVEGGGGEYTLAELPLLFVPAYRQGSRRKTVGVHNGFVRKLLSNVSHRGTLGFWRDQWPTWSGNARREWVQSTEGRIFQYLFDERLLLSVCAVDHTRLDFRQIVDEGCWLFVNAPYALLSDTISTLLGNLIVSSIFYACMQRPPGERPYRLILDEARFFNSGPLDVILETSRAYNLWLTLVVQNLDQMARARDGRIDHRLRETVINICRYFSVFHNTADSSLFSQLMFPITGTVPVGIRTSGDYERLPVTAEQDEHIRRFHNLRPRQMIWFDRLSDRGPEIWRTPDVIMPPADQVTTEAFEQEHLARVGAPVSAIRSEIQERQERVRRLLSDGCPEEVPERGLPPASFGNWE